MSTAPSVLEANKTALRAQALAARAVVPEAVRKAFAQQLADLGPGLALSCGLRAGQTIALFSALRGEPDTEPLTAALAEAGFRTALPVVVGPDQPLAFRAWRPGEPARPGAYGILEPGEQAAPALPGLLFVPLAAFDRVGHRIGYGGGFYDRTLALLRRRVATPAIGIAFACQEVEAVPGEAHDEVLDALVTERELVSFAPRP